MSCRSDSINFLSFKKGFHGKELYNYQHIHQKIIMKLDLSTFHHVKKFTT